MSEPTTEEEVVAPATETPTTDAPEVSPETVPTEPEATPVA